MATIQLEQLWDDPQLSGDNAVESDVRLDPQSTETKQLNDDDERLDALLSSEEVPKSPTDSKGHFLEGTMKRDSNLEGDHRRIKTSETLITQDQRHETGANKKLEDSKSETPQVKRDKRQPHGGRDQDASNVSFKSRLPGAQNEKSRQRLKQLKQSSFVLTSAPHREEHQLSPSRVHDDLREDDGYQKSVFTRSWPPHLGSMPGALLQKPPPAPPMPPPSLDAHLSDNANDIHQLSGMLPYSRLMAPQFHQSMPPANPAASLPAAFWALQKTHVKPFSHYSGDNQQSLINPPSTLSPLYQDTPPHQAHQLQQLQREQALQQLQQQQNEQTRLEQKLQSSKKSRRNKTHDPVETANQDSEERYVVRDPRIMAAISRYGLAISGYLVGERTLVLAQETIHKGNQSDQKKMMSKGTQGKKNRRTSGSASEAQAKNYALDIDSNSSSKRLHVDSRKQLQSASGNSGANPPTFRVSLKSWNCSFCMKMFRSRSEFRRHVRVHTGERPYPCNVCDARFKQKSHLKVPTADVL